MKLHPSPQVLETRYRNIVDDEKDKKNNKTKTFLKKYQKIFSHDITAINYFKRYLLLLFTAVRCEVLQTFLHSHNSNNLATSGEGGKLMHINTCTKTQIIWMTGTNTGSYFRIMAHLP